MLPSTVYCDNCGAANRPQARFCIACGQTMAAAFSLPPTVQAAPVVSSTGLLTSQSPLKGRYRILSRLGQGGMGAVYKAADTQLSDRLVAVKEMSQKGMDPQEVAEAATAFKREAHMLAGLFQRNLPRIYDHFAEAGRWYLVMDFIAGETLEEHLVKAGGKLPLEEVLDIGIQLSTVLSYLHSHQPPIIFRDLKPANVMRTPDGDLFLIDFGIARHFKAGQAKDTIAYGSAGYAAPEQYGKAQTTPQSDIYSLGTTLHHLLSGSDPSQSPFRFAPLSGAGIPAGLGMLIAQMLDMDADKRPTSMADVKKELERIAISLKASQLAPTRKAGGPPLPQTQLAAPFAQTSAPPTPQKTKEQWNSMGDTHFNAKRYQEAVAAYEQAIRLNPNDAVYHNNKGRALYNLKRYQEAVAAYEQAIRLDPNDALYHNNKGGALADLGRYQEAVAAYEQAIRLNPNDAVYHSNKWLALEKLGK